MAVNQYTVIENNQNKRPDILLFVNGIPLVVIELKNPADENATINKDFDQIQTYKATIPSLFTFNAFCVISDGLECRGGSVSAGFNRYMTWNSSDGKNEGEGGIIQVETEKKVAANNQYFAVNKAIENAIKASGRDGNKKGGVVWHTQGSGKSLSMVFFAGKLITSPNMQNPTMEFCQQQ